MYTTIVGLVRAPRIAPAFGGPPARCKVDRVETVFDGQPPLTRTASSVAMELIREAIVDGRLAPGQRLKEVQLANELGISRTPIREALLLLQAEGLVDAAPNRGSTVRAYDVRELQDMYELRAVLEGHAARRAAGRVTEAALDELTASCGRFAEHLADFEAGGRVTELVKENGIFHEMVLDAAVSERLAGMVRQVVVAPLVYRSYIWYSAEQARLSHQAHVQLVNALERRDGDRADAIMREHVFHGRDVLVARLEADAGR
jgi:DNA-binding GntR family transcriptional regulator